MEKSSCYEKFLHFLWQGREDDYNKATVTSLNIPQNILFVERILFAGMALFLAITMFVVEYNEFY